jgi:hypothetical protein
MSLAPLLLAALVAAPAPPRGQGPRRNVVSRVEATAEGDRVVVRIVGSTPASFTTSTAASPPRFVVDLAEGSFVGVPSRITVDDGVVAAIENAAVRSEGLPLARVTIVFARDVEPPDVVTSGTTVSVRIARPASAPALAAAAPAAAGTARQGIGGVEAPRIGGVEAPAPPPSPDGAGTPVPALRAGARDTRAVAPSTHSAMDGPEPYRHLREIGFKLVPDGARVFVRLSGATRFRVAEPRENLVVIELPNTQVDRRNDARALDTSFFPGAVVSVTPKRRGTTVLVEIALRRRVAHRQHMEGDTLFIDFERLP